MDSGKFTGGHKSNFSQTCTLLSQYLKEKGSFGDLNLGLSANFQPHGASTAAATKNLLPMIEKSGHNVGAPSKSVDMFPPQSNNGVAGEPERAQMTIFYGGQVIVFNDFPADKAEEIMAMASTTRSQNPKSFTTQKPLESARNLPAPKLLPIFGNRLMQQSPQMFSETFVNDMPIMRKASLAKFFEKRRDRITARAPYQVSKAVAATSRPVDQSKAWLALAAQSPLQIEPQF